jgi:hypothetical protein
MSLDLNKLANKIDEALSNETSETLTKFLNDKRMTNNKQQTAVDAFAEKTFNLIELMKRKWVNQEEFLDGMLKARNEAKEMEKEQIIEFGELVWKNLLRSDKIMKSRDVYNETYGGNK